VTGPRPAFDSYQERTGGRRRIPVMVLMPADGRDDGAGGTGRGRSLDGNLALGMEIGTGRIF
jgi:hypothetical protein